METGNLSISQLDGSWRVIHNSGAFGTTATTYTISGLDGDTDQQYQLLLKLVNSGSTITNYNLRLNNDTGANYGTQQLDGTSNVITAARDNTGVNIQLYSAVHSCTNFSTHDIYAKNGFVRTVISKIAVNNSGTNVSSIKAMGSSWKNTTDNITSLVFTSSVAGGLGTNSHIVLLAKQDPGTGTKVGNLSSTGRYTGYWQKIFEQNISTNANSLTIAGLDGDTDQIYRIVTFYKGGANASRTLYLRPNNDGGNNYGWQSIQGEGAVATANMLGAQNHINVGDTTWSDQVCMVENILYAKKGYERIALTHRVDRSSGTNVGRTLLVGYAWQDSTNNITSLAFVADAAGGLASGSAIQLYRLNL